MFAEVEEPVLDARLHPRITDELAELVAEVQASVVQVRSCERCSGSGFVWRGDGIILTNHHVVASRGQATVLLSDDRELPAAVIARDTVIDLAALKVDAVGLPAAHVGAAQEVRVGELVLAIGHPWGRMVDVALDAPPSLQAAA